MSDPFVFIGVILGILSVGVYVWSLRKAANLVDAISLILSGVGLFTGIKVCWISFCYREIDPIKDISIQVFIGGVAISWVAIQNGVRKFNF